MNKLRKDFGDFTISEIVDKSTDADTVYYIKDTEARRFWLVGDISDYSVSDIIRHITRFNIQDMGIEPKERKPITIWIQSLGGDVLSGFALVDTIKSSKTPVYTINLGCCYSMAFYVAISGHKRYAMEHSSYLIHSGSLDLGGVATQVRDTMEFNQKQEEGYKEFVLANTAITNKELSKKDRTEWFLSANEALERGCVDIILSGDVTIEDIV